MNRARWRRIEPILDRALEVEPERREEVVAEACGEDEELKRDVLAFLAACDDADTLFDAPPAHVVRDAFAAAGGPARDALEPGDLVGAYRIVERIGTGGMGVVYHAERADGEFEKHVALKVIKRGLDTEEIVARFHHERQILARLQHPNIAALLDGGATSAGLPYFVMEYARGEPIDRYLQRSGVGLEERVRLFLTVCDAVQHAHRNLVVHRDLKPSNILVARGEPKLLDFGIAKVLDPETGASESATRLADRRLTPDYAAPEQVLGAPVTTATDVYSLGVILYEIVAGRPPYRVRSRSIGEIQRVVCETDPLAPSDAAKDVRRAPAPDPPGWRVPPDLDAIVLNALHKEPHRRYPSVGAFAEDLRRFLEGRPVRARPDTSLYRISKFVRRNARLVGVGAAAVLALVAGVVVAGWQARIAAAERDRREQEARTAAAARDFLILTLEGLDPDRLGGQREFTHDQLIDRGLRNVDALSEEPEVRAPVMNTLARVTFNLGERDRADSLYTEALALLEPLAPHADLAVSLMGIGRTRQRDRRFAEARDAYRRALDMRREVLDEGDPAIAESRASLAFALYNLGHAASGSAADTLFAEAEGLYQEALSGLVGATSLRARTLEGLGDIELERGRRAWEAGDTARGAGLLERAETHYREAIRTGVRTANDTTPDDARRMWGLATTLDARGEGAEAVRTSRRALGVLMRTYGESHPDVALAHYYLGTHQHNAGLHPDAAASFDRSAAISADQGGAYDLYTADAHVRAGSARLEAGHPTEALVSFDRSIPWYEASVREAGADPALVAARLANTHENRGRALSRMGDPAAALRPLRTAWRIWTEELGRPRSAVEAASLLSDAFQRLERPDSAGYYRDRAAELSGG